MSALDLALRGGTVVAADGARRADVGVAGGRIAAIAPEVDERAAEEVDATGPHVLPGVVDAHVHLNDPGRADWEGFETGSRALAAGGTTTCADMPLNAVPPTVDVAAFDAKVAAAGGAALVDFALWGGIVPGNRGHLAELAARGVVGFKAFMAASGVPEFPMADDLTLYEGMREAAALGLPVAVHAESEAIRARSRRERSPRAAPRCATTRARAPRSPRSRPSAGRSCSPARPAARCTSCTSRPVAASRSWPRRAPAASTRRARSARTTSCSTRTTPSASARSRSAPRPCAPPRSATRCGRRSTRSRSSPPTTPPHRPRSRAATTCSPRGAASRAPSRCSRSCSTRATASAGSRSSGWRSCAPAAPRAGCACAPRAGSSRAPTPTLVLADLDATTVVAPETLEYRHRHSPYAGRTLRGRVVRTIVRGTTVVAAGRVVAAPGGRLVTPEPTEEGPR